MVALTLFDFGCRGGGCGEVLGFMEVFWVEKVGLVMGLVVK